MVSCGAIEYAFMVPTLRQEREGESPHCVGDASEIKSFNKIKYKFSRDASIFGLHERFP
jgi:hypothetical protein